MRDYEDALTKPTELAVLMKDRGIEFIALGITEATADKPEGGLAFNLNYFSEKELIAEAVDEFDMAELFSVEQGEIFNNLDCLFGGILRLNDDGNPFIYGIGGGGGPLGVSGRLSHMLDCVYALKNHLSLIKEARFIANDPSQAESAVIDAAVWQLARFGEACAAIPREDWNNHGDIDFKAYKALRNKLIHQYFNISSRRIWREAKRCVALESVITTAIAIQQNREQNGIA